LQRNCANITPRARVGGYFQPGMELDGIHGAMSTSTNLSNHVCSSRCGRELGSGFQDGVRKNALCAKTSLLYYCCLITNSNPCTVINESFSSAIPHLHIRNVSILNSSDRIRQAGWVKQSCGYSVFVHSHEAVATPKRSVQTHPPLFLHRQRPPINPIITIKAPNTTSHFFSTGGSGGEVQSRLFS
jgi:hypothetical protein